MIGVCFEFLEVVVIVVNLYVFWWLGEIWNRLVVGL